MPTADHPMFPSNHLTCWTNDQVDAMNARMARIHSQSRAKKKPPFTPAPYNRYWLVFADHVEAVDLSSYSACVAQCATAFSAPDFRGVVAQIRVTSGEPTYQVETKPGRWVSRDHLISTLGEAVDKVRVLYDAAVAEQARYDSDPEYALSVELKGADWFYTYSDDGRVYRAGAAHFELIAELVARCGQVGKDMFGAARPKSA